MHYNALAFSYSCQIAPSREVKRDMSAKADIHNPHRQDISITSSCYTLITRHHTIPGRHARIRNLGEENLILNISRSSSSAMEGGLGEGVQAIRHLACSKSG